MAKKRPIKYTSRDFNSIKKDLEDYARRYYPDSYKDFTEASFGSLMLDSVSYIGDILSYYLDYSVNESFFDTAIEYNNVLRHARRLGYKHGGNASSTGLAALFILVPAVTTGLGPDQDYIPLLKRGASFTSVNGINFVLTENVNFNDPKVQTVVARVNDTTGIPTFYALKAYGTVVSGEMVRETITIKRFERFRRIKLKNNNYTEMVSITDAEGNVYHEVDHLSQNVIYKEFSNPNFSTDNTPSILKPVVVARRFTIERDSVNNVFIQFGYGSDEDININKVADPSNVVIDSHGKSHVTDINFDPYKLLKTDKFGVAPSNTLLTINYRVNNPSNVNVGENAIVNVRTSEMEFPDNTKINTTDKNSVTTSLEVTNETPIVGDVSVATVDEIKIRAKSFFASQNRAVTAQDYESVCYAMPEKFGAIKRCRVLQDDNSMRRNINVLILSEDNNEYLVKTSSTIKKNLKTWLSKYKMINDTIDILDAYVVNLGIDFKVTSEQDVNKFEILQDCVNIIKEEYENKHLIGQPFEISRIYKILNKVDGVVGVKDVQIVQKTTSKYSSVVFPIDSMISPDGRYIMAPKNVVFEVKYPDSDIRGSIE
jgi:hypothetical protein